MTIDIVYLTPDIRCYRDGHIERFFRKKYWKICKFKPTTEGYLRIAIDKKNYFVHRLMGYCFLGLNLDDPSQTIDHIDHSTTDNRVSELRIATMQQQKFNSKDSKGYTWRKNINKWQAQIGIDDKTINLGYFVTEEDARAAYLEAKKIHHIF